MREEQQQEESLLEHYLRALRKKVQHHIKNPFQIPFANYSFEELSSWKNSILQLDVTSILYGQRVDHLHGGTMVVLDNMLKNVGDSKIEQMTNLDAKVKQNIMNEQNPLQKHIEEPRKLSASEVGEQKNLVLWREIMKKRDTLPLLMLNQLPLSNDLRLQLCETTSQKFYDALLNDQGFNYLKHIDFGYTNTKFSQIFTFISDFIEAMNYELMSLSKPLQEKVRAATIYEDIINFEFGLSFDRSQNYNMQQIEFKEIEVGGLNDQNVLVESKPVLIQTDEEDTLTIFSLFSDITINTDQSKLKKPKKKQNANKKKTTKREEVFVNFIGLNLTKNQVFKNEKEDEIDEKYLNPKDHLLLKFIKYNYPFRKSRKTNIIQPINYFTAAQDPHFPIFQSQINNQSIITILGNKETSFNNFSQSLQRNSSKIKQAVLSIREMKKRIRRVIQGRNTCQMRDLKTELPTQDCLDIFITTLHIAAEDGILLTF